MTTASGSPYSAEDEQALMTELWSPKIAENPYNFVMFAFPWGVPGTPLEHMEGPRQWQKDELERIAEHIQVNKELLRKGDMPVVYQSATASGRGIGKSALTAWMNLYLMSCAIGSTSVTTANTEPQLKSKTWAELGKWHTMAINSHWFDKQAMSLRPAKWFDRQLKKELKIDTGYYYAEAQLWSEENPDAFAGAHNFKGMMYIFDEASGIPPAIWNVVKGVFTEPILHRYLLVFSNPRRNTGAFFECFHKNRKYWQLRNIDSRSVEGTDKMLLESIITEYGEDSDEARMEVKGQFPRQGDNQFISRDIVDGAIKRDSDDSKWAPLYMGVDVARYGDDCSVIAFRQGRDATKIPWVKMKHADNMEVANKCVELINKYNPDAICIDAGNGTGVIDRLRELGYRIHEVWFGSKSSKPEWANKRTELWAIMREWLKGASINDDQMLIDDLVGPEYKFMGTSDRIRLETKEEMKKRGVASPDKGDALAVTFAVKVASQELKASRAGRRRGTVTEAANMNIFDR